MAGARNKANRRADSKAREFKALARTATFDPETSAVWGGRNRAKLVVAVVLLIPLGLVTTQTFLEYFAAETVGGDFWRGEAFWFFGVGFVFWLICFWGLPRPMYLYVLGHELTHYAFVKVCRGRVEAWDAKSHGGYVYTDKTNALISLSPYFVPFYTVIVGVVFSVLSLLVDLDRKFTGLPLGLTFEWQWLFLGLIGLTWGFHLTFTVWMITKDQPDLESNGTFFSVLLIYWVNLVIICALLITASPRVGFGGFLATWWENAGGMWEALAALGRGIGLLFGYFFARG